MQRWGLSDARSSSCWTGCDVVLKVALYLLFDSRLSQATHEPTSRFADDGFTVSLAARNGRLTGLTDVHVHVAIDILCV